MPLGIRLLTNNHKSTCIKCGTCDGHPCLLYGKSDAATLCVDPALEHSNATLITNAYVTKLETSASGREVSTVHVQRFNEKKMTFSAKIVVASCGAINSAALLLRSANDRHPHGLANSSGVVGRHYMGHVNSVLMAISTKGAQPDGLPEVRWP